MYISESNSERLGFTLKQRCVCVYHITRAKMKHVLYRAFLDSLTRTSAYCDNCPLPKAFTGIHMLMIIFPVTAY